MILYEFLNLLTSLQEEKSERPLQGPLARFYPMYLTVCLVTNAVNMAEYFTWNDGAPILSQVHHRHYSLSCQNP